MRAPGGAHNQWSPLARRRQQLLPRLQLLGDRVDLVVFVLHALLVLMLVFTPWRLWTVASFLARNACLPKARSYSAAAQLSGLPLPALTLPTSARHEPALGGGEMPAGVLLWARSKDDKKLVEIAMALETALAAAAK